VVALTGNELAALGIPREQWAEALVDAGRLQPHAWFAKWCSDFYARLTLAYALYSRTN
jgi:hypothetical protein